MKRRISFQILLKVFFCIFLLAIVSCNSDDVKDAVDLADGVEKKDLDYSILGINAFANDSRFGGSAGQYSEVRDTLKLNRVRVLFNWDDGVQPSPSSELKFSFFDSLISSIPEGMDILVVTAELPSWMSSRENWVNGNPRETFVREFFAKVVKRYPRVGTWQVWNEPNDPANPDNNILGVTNSAVEYVEMLALAYSAMQQQGSGAQLINAATTAINQNYSGTLDYNRAMRDAGAQSFINAWAIHYYGKQYENVVRSGGVADFLNGLDKRIWVTESGEQGFDKQLDYAQRTFPYLKDKIDGLDRIYIYQFTEATGKNSTYGLRSLDGENPLSDLYVNLRDRP